jgi:putative pyruvate formate lyase activating enzyme
MEIDHQGTLKALDALIRMMAPCVLCPRQCGIDRMAGEKGFCELAAKIVVSDAMPHHGEEPPLSGTLGAGTIFFSSCNLRCLYCQNHQISRRTTGSVMDPEGLAGVMLRLQGLGCHNIDAVTPTPQIPLIMAALLSARRQGLTIPFIYNCGGYEAPEVIRLLAGMVEIYLPDMKYGRDDLAWQLSGVKEYTVHAVASLREMTAQVGNDLEIVDGVARQGILIRHLVLPGMLDNSFAVLEIIRRELSKQIPLSIMSQYTPAAQAREHPLLGRRLYREEYEKVVNHALKLGFEQLFVQQVDERNLLPDFEKESPFNWEQQ